MKSIQIKFISLSIIALFLVSACKKYPDGPSISLRSKKERLSNTWVIGTALVNDVDKTSDFTNNIYKNFILEVKPDGTYNSSYLWFNLVAYSESGTWVWANEKKQVLFNRIVNGVSNGSHLFDILRLKEKELWFKERQSNGDVWEWHMKPQ